MFASGITSIRKYTMSLLDKIDILITPNAYKKGKLFAALPSPTFGGDLAVDGDFADGSTAWTLNPGWSIGGNSARYDGNALGTSIAQNISGVTGGNRYTVTFEVTQNTGDQNNTVSLGSTTLTNSTHLPLGCNTFTGVAGFGTALNIYGNSGEILIIRNLTVKQELTGIADLDFTRASAATRVDPLGFINYAGVLPGVEQVTNGNFQQIGPEEVSNGDFSQEGPELVTNGDFATDSGWIKGIGWSIAGGKAKGRSTTSNLQQLGILQSGKTYKLTFTISDYVSGSLRPNIGTVNGTLQSSNGTFTEYITSLGSHFYFDGVSAFTGSIDNVSIKEIGQDWTLGIGWSLGNGYAESDGTNAPLDQYNALEVGKQYIVVITVTGMTASPLSVRLGTSSSDQVLSIISDGTYTAYGEAGSTTFRLRSAGFNGKVTNVSVKEVFQGWTIGTSPELSLGSVTFNSNSQTLSQNWLEETGTTYYVKLEGTGPVRFRTGFAGLPGQLINVTLPDTITVNTDADTNRIQIYGSNSGTAVLTNVSVVEEGEIDIPRIDYTGGGCPHILVEPQRTNLITYSEDFEDATYGEYLVSYTPNFATSPSGESNATKLTSSGVYGNISLNFTKATSSITYTQSIFIKPNNYTLVNFISYGASSSNRSQVTFDLSNGTISSAASSTGAFTNASATITSYTNDYYKISLTYTTDSSAEVRPTISFPVEMDSTNYVIIWGYQLEEGSYPTSYIPTEGTIATRAQETYESAEDISGLINDSEGVLFVEMARQEGDTSAGLITLNDGTNSQTVSLYYFSTGTIYFDILSGSPNVSQGVSGIDTYSFNKIAIKYKSGDIALWINGVEEYTSSNAISLTGLNTLSFSQGNDAYPFKGKVKQLQVYDTALTDEELTLLTIPPNSTYSTYAEMANALNYTLQ